jgi:nucleotide-binding universal stress UspA family protein
MYKRILVPVDGSEGSMKALQQAVALHRLTGSDLWILTVFRHHGMQEASMSMVRPSDPENLDDALRSYAKEIAESAKTKAIEMGATAPRAFVKSGQPARTIVAFAKEHAVDLLVIGSRGVGDLEGYLLGSVSHKVTSLAKCPVLVV